MKTTPLASQLRWLIGLRLVVITSVAALYLLVQLLPEQPGPGVEASDLPALPDLDWHFLSLLVGLTYAASLVYIGLLRWLRDRPHQQASIQFAGDLLLVSALVYYFGGIASPFSILYLVVIAVASSLLRRRASLLVASAAYLTYAAILTGLYLGFLPPPHSPFVETGSLARLQYNLVTHLFGFYGVALLTSFLAQSAERAEQALEERIELFANLTVEHRDVVESIPSGLATTDLSGVITSLNRAGSEILGRDEHSLLGQPIHATGLFGPRQWQEESADCLAGGRVRSEVELGNETGSVVPVGYSLTPLTDSHQTTRGFILVFQDLSEWHELQAELRLKDRMAAVGELAAGIAHEIGNPLAAISGSVQMLASGGGSGGEPQRQRLLDIVVRESQRLDRTVKGFLRFARPKERSTARFDIARLLAEHVTLLRNSREVGDRHHFEVDLDPPNAQILADPDQIAQIFWNLVRNAVRAMPEGGKLKVTGRLAGDQYRFQVTDDGCGMTEEERSKLFQPFKSFFDGGSGIGMAIVYRIVQEHGGRLSVESAPGRGTTVTVELPVAPGIELPAAIRGLA